MKTSWKEVVKVILFLGTWATTNVGIIWYIHTHPHISIVEREKIVTVTDTIVETQIVYRDTSDSQFFKAILEIESGAVSMFEKDSSYLDKQISAENGRGKGHLGIYEVCVRGTGFHKVLGYSHDDMFELEKSSHVFWAMMGIFSDRFARKYGRYPTREELARMWSGGPDGHKKKSTNNYAKKYNRLYVSLRNKG